MNNSVSVVELFITLFTKKGKTCIEKSDSSHRLRGMLDALFKLTHRVTTLAALGLYLPPSLAAGLAVRYSPRPVRSPAAHAPGVRSGRSRHTLPTRPGSLPGRPAAGSGLSSHTRLRQPAGAVCLRPRAQPALRRRLAYWKRYRGRVVSVVTPGQRRTPYAWSSGLLRYLACSRTSSPSVSAGGKG